MKKNKLTDEKLKKGMFKNAEKWANKVLENFWTEDRLREYEKYYLDYAIFGEMKYTFPLTKLEEEAFMKEYNDNNPHQYSKFETLSAAEIIERYKSQLTEEQLKELEKYDRKR